MKKKIHSVTPEKSLSFFVRILPKKTFCELWALPYFSTFPHLLAHFLFCYASCTLTLHRASFALIISYLPSAACSVGAVLMTSIKTRLSRFTPFLIRSPVSLAMRVPFLFLSQRRARALDVASNYTRNAIRRLLRARKAPR
jgi:hypothetical protein